MDLWRFYGISCQVCFQASLQSVSHCSKLHQSQPRTMTSWQSASCRLVEFRLWLADMAFFLSSTLMAGMQPWIYARVELFTRHFSPSHSLHLSTVGSGNQTVIEVCTPVNWLKYISHVYIDKSQKSFPNENKRM